MPWVRQNDPGQVLVVGFLECVADGRQAVESRRPGFRRLAFMKHDRQRRPPWAAAQEACQVVQALDGETERIQQLEVPFGERSLRFSFGVSPIRTPRDASLQFMGVPTTPRC